MNFELDADQQRWRLEVRAFLAENCTETFNDEVRVHGFESPGPEQRLFWRKVAERGWLGLAWPAEYGGQGRGPIDQYILNNEFEYWGAHRPGLEVTSIAPMILRYGTEHNKAEYLPLIARGELVVAVGYSEPNAGTDLAGLQTRAELDGDEWVINGQKIWNSYAHVATHEWLCVRTDPAAPRHKGISVIMVPIDTPGIEIRPLLTWNDMRTNEAFLDDVRVPRTNLIGEVNRGWEYITGALDLERGVVTNAGDLRSTVDGLILTARRPLPDGRRPADDQVVRRRLAQLDADVEALALLGLEACSLLDDGVSPSMTVTVAKIHSSELRQQIADVATQLFGMYGVLTYESAFGQVAEGAEKQYRAAPLMRFGGGTNEVLRDAIARRGYDMPVSRR